MKKIPANVVFRRTEDFRRFSNRITYDAPDETSVRAGGVAGKNSDEPTIYGDRHGAPVDAERGKSDLLTVDKLLEATGAGEGAAKHFPDAERGLAPQGLCRTQWEAG